MLWDVMRQSDSYRSGLLPADLPLVFTCYRTFSVSWTDDSSPLSRVCSAAASHLESNTRFNSPSTSAIPTCRIPAFRLPSEQVSVSCDVVQSLGESCDASVSKMTLERRRLRYSSLTRATVYTTGYTTGNTQLHNLPDTQQQMRKAHVAPQISFCSTKNISFYQYSFLHR